MNSYNKGIVPLSTAFTVGDVATDPTTVTFTLKGNGETVSYVYGTDDELIKDSTGNYHVDYTFEESGYYQYSFVGTGDCAAVDSDYVIIGSTADLIDLARYELEDIDETLFTDAVISRGIEKALVLASKYIPCEKRIEVDLTASSKDVDISNIKGLIKVLKAEFKVDQDPKQFRNISKFANIITIDTDLTPETGDTAYLYCHTYHTPDTLDIDLLNIVPRIAAGYVAINNVGDGRTQIQSAIDAAALINSSTDSMTARLTQAATDTASIRTQTTALLSSTNTALENVESTLTAALAELALADTATDSIVITTELADIDTELDKAIADMGNARSALATKLAGISDELTSIGAEIVLGIGDLATARGLNNKIPVGANPESQLHASANGEFNAAMARINEIKTQLQEGTGIGQENILAGNQVNIVQGLLSKARDIISAYSNQTGGYSRVASGQISTANSYIAEARTLISKIVNAINAYSTATRNEIAIANSHLSQASGYVREITGRLNVANIISSYVKWGQNEYAGAINELRTMQKPRVFKTYPRS